MFMQEEDSEDDQDAEMRKIAQDFMNSDDDDDNASKVIVRVCVCMCTCACKIMCVACILGFVVS